MHQWCEELAADVRYTFRAWKRQRLVGTVAILILAISIGMTTAILTLVDAVLFRPLPYAEPARLVALAEIPKSSTRRFDMRSVAPANYLDWREQARSFNGMAAVAVHGANLSGRGEPERIRAAICDLSFFDVLGVAPQIGRAFSTADSQASNGMALLSHGFWQRRFGGDASIVGSALTIDGEVVTVAGIMPQTLEFPQGTDIWMPPRRLVPDAGVAIGDERHVRGLHYLDVIARLAPGVSIDRARAEMIAVVARLRDEYPQTNAEREIKVLPLHEALVGDVRPRLVALLAAVGCVLLVACANVASLLLARAETRHSEFAVRAALGASGGRLARQAFVEAVVLAATAGVAGVMLARWSLSVLLTSVVSGTAYISVPSIDRATLGWTAALVLGTAVLFGTAPAWRVSAVDLAADLRGPHGALSGAAGRRPLVLLVVAEIALTLALSIGGTLLIRSFVRMRQESPGFVTDHVLTFRLAPSGAAYATERRLAAFFSQVLDRVGGLPGVAAVGAIDSLPMVDAGSYLHFSVERRGALGSSTPSANYRIVSPTYFTTLGIQLRKGRALSKHDTADSRGVILVNETLAREMFPSDDPIGQRLAFVSTRNGAPLWLEIVGVVGDVRTNGLSVPVKPEAYRPYAQAPWPGMTFVARTEGRPEQTLAGIRSAVAAIDSGQPVASISTLDDLVADSLSRPRFQAWLMTTFSAFALALVALGMYGVMTYTVAQRTREFGLRLALGASPAALLRSVMREAVGMAAGGLLLGVTGMLAGARVIARLVESSVALDPSAFALAATVVMSVTLAASLSPARRIMRLDPIVALRDE